MTTLRKDGRILSESFSLESQRVGLPTVWMYGGGRQSCCIAALIIQGKLPRPDYAAIADTGREKQSTWDYLKNVVQPALPFKIHIVPKSEFATVDVWGGADGKTLLIPAFTNESGSIGKLDTFCSNEWKVRVVERWLARRDVRKYQSWIGFSLNEAKRWIRLKKSQGDYVSFPLVDAVPTNTDRAISIVEEMGWPTPKHSSCWMCPNMNDDEWADLTPEELEAACQFDEQIRLIDPNAYLHKSCVALRQVVFARGKDEARPCESGVCFV